MEEENIDNDRIQVWFMQDTSGSCSGFRTRFFKAAMSLDPKKFDIKMHCFDTQVYETTIESRKLYGFGGTSFSVIERYIQQHVSKKEEYPKAVFVITDGYGDPVQPQIPERWYWFLSHNARHCIPKESNVFLLSDYE